MYQSDSYFGFLSVKEEVSLSKHDFVMLVLWWSIQWLNSMDRFFLFQGLLRVRGRPAVAYDQQGLVFAVAMEGGAIKLFDVRSYDKVSECMSTYHMGSIVLVFTGVCSLDQKHN